jgi:hypothetical protein
VGSFTITFSGYTPGITVYAEQCDGIASTAPGYSPDEDCDIGTEPAGVIASASGTGTFTAYDHNFGFYAFEGDSPSDLFNCLYPGEADPGDGNPSFTNCQLKLTTSDSTNNASDAFLTLTLPQPVAAVPETNYDILLPAGALLLMAGAYVVARKRRRIVTDAVG